jgi:hypothetical protein
MSDDHLLRSAARALAIASWRSSNPAWLAELILAAGHALPKRRSIPKGAVVISETDANL